MQGTDVQQSKPNAIVNKRYYSDQVIDKNAYEEFIAIRSILLRNKPFWGVVAIDMVYVETSILPTMAVDMFHIYVNPKFFMWLTEKERFTAIAHELLHIINGEVQIKVVNTNQSFDINRCGDRNPKKWNIAIDHVVNLQAYESGFEKFTSFKACDDDKYKDMAGEEIYELLEDFDDSNCMDTHVIMEVSQDEDGNFVDSEGNKIDGKIIQWKDIANRMTDFDQTLMRAYMAHQQKAQYDSSAGSIPYGIIRAVEELAIPKVNWRDKLRAFLTEMVSEDYSYKMPDMRFFNQGLSLPGFEDVDDDALDGGYFMMDLSGSVSQKEQEHYVGEIYDIISNFAHINITAGSFDYGICQESMKTFTDNNIKDFSDFCINLRGGGGTGFECVFDYFKENNIVPKFLIIATDGYPCNTWGTSDYCPTMFLITRPKGSEPITATFGESINIYYDI